MSAHELAEWAAYEAVEPWGAKRADWNAAMIASTIFNMGRGPESDPASLSDYLLDFGLDKPAADADPDAERQAQANMLAYLQQQYGGELAHGEE